MREALARLPALLTAHLELALVALALGTLASVPAGIWLTRHRRFERRALGLASAIQTIPGLALLALSVPALAALGQVTRSAFGLELSSIGYLPAILALTLYSLLPILRNTVIGLDSVDASLLEAARGVGMTDREQLRWVEIPLAAPVIVAGIRTSAVWTVGMATLSTPVGAPSLGNYIFGGLQTRNFAEVLVGCVAAAALALLLDDWIRRLEVGARERRLARGPFAALALLYGYTLVSLVSSGGPAEAVRIGSKPFTEQYILSEILARAVNDEARIETELVSSLGSNVAFDALRGGAIDAYVDYTGTIWTTILKREERLDRMKLLEAVGEALREEHGVRLVAPLGFENAYALAMRSDRARTLGIARLSDLAAHAARLAIGGDYEFFARPEWAAIESTYALEFREERSMDPSLMYPAVAAREVDVVSAYSTDGRIAAFGLTVLEDDRGAIPPYDAVILARPGLDRDQPEAFAAFAGLEGAIDAESMRRMNAKVDEAGETPARVAAAFNEARAKAPREARRSKR